MATIRLLLRASGIGHNEPVWKATRSGRPWVGAAAALALALRDVGVDPQRCSLTITSAFRYFRFAGTTRVVATAAGARWSRPEDLLRSA